MKNRIVQLHGGIETTSKPHTVFRVSNGKTESRAFRDFYDSQYKAGDKVELFRYSISQMVMVEPGDILIRRSKLA